MLGVLLLLPALYVASIGPAGHLVVADRMTMERYRALYAPIVWCEDESPAIHGAGTRYRLLFVGRKEWLRARLLWLGRNAVTY